MEGKLSRAQQEAKAYVEFHNLEKLVGELLNTLVHEKDPNPKIYMIKYLAGQLPQEQLEENGITIQGPFPKPRALVRYPQFTEDCNSLLKKYLNREIWDRYRDQKTDLQGEFYACIYPGIENQDHPIGLVAVDEQAFSLYEKLFTPIISELHSNNRSPQQNWDEMSYEPSNLVQTARVAIARNLKSHSFSPNLNPVKRKQIQDILVSELQKVKSGQFHTVESVSEEIKGEFQDLMLSQGDKYQNSFGVNAEWPYNRGIWVSDDKSLFAQINVEDHLTLIGQGQSIQEATQNLQQNFLGMSLEWARTEGWGYATVNINKLGPAMTISLYLKDDLKVVGQQQIVSKWASTNGFQFFGGQKKTIVVHSKVEQTESAFLNQMIKALSQLEAEEQQMKGEETEQMDIEPQENQEFKEEEETQGEQVAQEYKPEETQDKAEIKVYYFDMYFRAESIRMLLKHAKIQFEDVRVKKEDWPQLKLSMPGGQMPVVELQDGSKLNQADSILRYLGQLHGYYPNDPMVAYEVDKIIDTFMDVFSLIPKPVMGPPENKEEAVKSLFEALTNFLDFIKPICEKGEWLAGDQLTIADFCIGGLYANYFNNATIFEKQQWDDLLQNYAEFKAYGERFIQANAEYLEQRPPASL